MKELTEDGFSRWKRIMQEVAMAVGGTVEGVDSVVEKGGMKDIDRTGHDGTIVGDLHEVEDLHFGEDSEDDVEDCW